MSALRSVDRPRRVLWLDATAGIAGDMVLGALVDAAADRSEMVRAVSNAVATVASEVSIGWEETSRGGLRAFRAVVTASGSADDRTAPDRSVADIRTILDSPDLPSSVHAPAGAVFERVIAAEATVHGVPPEQVHLHEVGGWDSIADIVGVCAALDLLDVDEVVVSPIAVGSGQIRSAHGLLPVPVPGVTELLRGWQIESGGDGELATPTGAAIAVTLGTRQGPLPSGRLVSVGVGAGSRDRPDRANVVRALLLEVDPAVATGIDAAGAGVAPLDEIACTVDDLDPRVWPTVLSRLLSDGALDTWLVPVVMKKGRPGHVLHVLCRPQDTERLGRMLLHETSSLGYRTTRVSRTALERAWVDVQVDGLTLPVKLAVEDGVVLRAVAEFDEAQAAATVLGRPVRDVLESAAHAAAEQRLVAGAAVPDGARRTRES